MATRKPAAPLASGLAWAVVETNKSQTLVALYMTRVEARWWCMRLPDTRVARIRYEEVRREAR
jgi:hypothetical protein